MKTYEHITKLENIMNEHEQKLKELNEVLTYISEHFDEYKQLIEYYYYSNQRNQDLQDEEMHLIPDDLPRGVLSEDGVYDFSSEYYDSGIRMIEIGLKMVKER